MKLMNPIWLVAAVIGCAVGRAGPLPGPSPAEAELEVELAAARYIKKEFGDAQLAFDGRHAPYGAPSRGLNVPTGPRSPQALGRILAELDAVPFPSSGVPLCTGVRSLGCVGNVVIMEAPVISGDTADIWVYIYSEITPSPEIGEFWWRFLRQGRLWEFDRALSQRIIMLQRPPPAAQAVWNPPDAAIEAVAAAFLAEPSHLDRANLVVDTSGLRQSGHFDEARLALLASRLDPRAKLGMPSFEAGSRSETERRCVRFRVVEYEQAGETLFLVGGWWARSLGDARRPQPSSSG